MAELVSALPRPAPAASSKDPVDIEALHLGGPEPIIWDETSRSHALTGTVAGNRWCILDLRKDRQVDYVPLLYLEQNLEKKTTVLKVSAFPTVSVLHAARIPNGEYLLPILRASANIA